MKGAKIIAICNQKGGVGKTTTTVNLGIGLAKEGKRVLVIDADPQGDLTTCLGWKNGDELQTTLADLMNKTLTERPIGKGEGILHHEEGVDLLPSNLELSAMEMNLVNAMSREMTLKNCLKEIKKDYEYILIDCMPSLGMITVNALAAADSVMIPVQAQYLPAKGMTQLVQTIGKVQRTLNPDLRIDGIVLTLVDGRTNLAKQTLHILRNQYGNRMKIYSSQIPVAVKAAETSFQGKSIYAYDKNSSVAKAYENLTKEVMYVSDNWVVQNLQNSLENWNEKLAEVWELLTESPEDFRGGGIWEIIQDIHGALMAIGLALLVLFFVVGVIKTCGSFTEVKKPEHAVKLFVRFAIAKGVVTYGLELMMALFEIVQGIISTIMKASGLGNNNELILPDEMAEAIEDCGFFESIPLWAVTLICSLVITILSFIIILSVYVRFFKLYIYTAIAPVPLSTFAGEPTQQIGKSFLKSYAAVCLEGAIILLACIIFSVFAESPPVVNQDAAPAAMVWSYVGELIFNMLVLVGAVKLADRIVREMMGL